MRENFDPTKAYLSSGTVQPIVLRHTPWLCHSFGAAQYHRDLPVLTDGVREQAQPIVDRLNAGEITDEQAKAELSKIWC